MKFSRILPAVAVVALALFFTCAWEPISAGGMGNGNIQRKMLVVDSIDATAGTVAFKSKIDQSVHTYKIDAVTKIILVNAKVTINQITTGMKVADFKMMAGQAAPAGGQMPADGQTLATLLVSRAPPAAPATP